MRCLLLKKYIPARKSQGVKGVADDSHIKYDRPNAAGVLQVPAFKWPLRWNPLPLQTQGTWPSTNSMSMRTPRLQNGLKSEVFPRLFSLRTAKCDTSRGQPCRPPVCRTNSTNSFPHSRFGEERIKHEPPWRKE